MRKIVIPTFVALVFATSATLAIAQSQTQSQQTHTQPEADKQVAKAATGDTVSTPAAAAAPVYTDYKGVKIGMSATQVRDALKSFLKDKGDKQDFLMLSDTETAQVYYDSAGKVTAISIDYLTKNGHAPTPMEVLGIDITPKPDGSMYALKRYPAAGYWVSYNRTSGDNAIVTITMQAL